MNRKEYKIKQTYRDLEFYYSALTRYNLLLAHINSFYSDNTPNKELAKYRMAAEDLLNDYKYSGKVNLAGCEQITGVLKTIYKGLIYLTDYKMF